MDAEIEELALYLVQKLEHTPLPTRILVGIAGIPASGKSTLSHRLTEHINRLLDARIVPPTASDIQTPGDRLTVDDPGHKSAQIHDQAILIGLDGWHFSRAQLDVFPDPQAAHDRRGSHWTFDGEGYAEFVRQLHDTATVKVLPAPTFDHALKDPTPDAVSIYPHHRIVIIEGLYTFLAIPPWSTAGLLLDERWFIEVDPIEGRRRLVERHVLTGVAKDAAEAEWRADNNDGPNGQFIISNMLDPMRVIRSKDIPGLSTPMEASVDTSVI